MIGHQEGVGGAAPRGHCIAVGIDHEMLGRVAGADAAHIADVVVERRQDGMPPIAGRDGPLETAAAQDVLQAKGDQGGVLAVMVERVAAGDALDDEPGGLFETGGEVRLPVAKDSAVGLGQVSAQCIG